MAIVKCKECGEKVSTAAKTCPHCGAKPPKKTSLFTWLVLLFIIFIVYKTVQTESNMTPEQQIARNEQRSIEAKQKEIELANAAAKKAEEDKVEQIKGFHCLSKWNGSHPEVTQYAEKNMRDPDSFEHIETSISPVNANGTHQLVMQYRAKNGFGGMSVGSISATIDNKTCKATITSIE